MNRKYLDEIGCTDRWDNNFSNPKMTKSRQEKIQKTLETKAIDPREIWNLDTTAEEWLYERLRLFQDVAANKVDLTYHKFTYSGKEYTQEELIEEMIVRLEFVLGDLDIIKKNTKMYKKLKANPYIVKYGRYNNWDKDQSMIEFQIWSIWSIIFPTMWW